MSRNILLVDDPEITSMFGSSIEYRASKLWKKVEIATANDSLQARLAIEKGKVDVLITWSIPELHQEISPNEIWFKIAKSLKELNPNSYIIWTSNNDREKDWEWISNDFSKKLDLVGKITKWELDVILFWK
jgi:hypothetical protein